MVGLQSFSNLQFIGDSRGPPGCSVCESWTSANKFLIPLADFGVFGSVKFGLTPCGESELVPFSPRLFPTQRATLGPRLGFSGQVLYPSSRQKYPSSQRSFPLPHQKASKSTPYRRQYDPAGSDY